MTLTGIDDTDAVTISATASGRRPRVKRHLLSAADLSRDDAELVLTTAAELRELADRPIKKLPPSGDAPWSTSSSRTQPAPASPSRPPPSG